MKEFVSKLRPGYTLPEGRTIHKIQATKKKDLQENLKVYVKKNCVVGTLSADGWSRFSRSYFALLLHFIDVMTLEPVTVLLGLVRKSKQDAKALRDQTEEILNEWGFDDQLQLPWEERYSNHYNKK